MKETVQLSIAGGLLAVWNLEVIRRITRLLGKDLGKSDHILAL